MVNGSGLNNSIVGIREEFSVYLNDMYQYPSLVEAGILQVQILRDNDSYSVSPIIYPMLNNTGISKDKLTTLSSSFDNCILPVIH